VICLIYYNSMMIIQFLTVTLTGLGVVVLLALREPFKSSKRHKAEILEECMTMVTMYHVFCFTEFISDPVVKHYIGYSLITSISVHLLFFLGAIAYLDSRKKVRSLTIKYYKRQSKKAVSKWRPGQDISYRMWKQGKIYRRKLRKQKRRAFEEYKKALASESDEDGSDSPRDKEPEKESTANPSENPLDKPIVLISSQEKGKSSLQKDKKAQGNIKMRQQQTKFFKESLGPSLGPIEEEKEEAVLEISSDGVDSI